MSESTAYAPFKARWVMGSPYDIVTVDHEKKPVADPAKHHWFMGFAVPKGPEWDAVYATMWNAAANDPACTQALCGQAGFNWKIEDCDAPENPQNLGKASYPAGHMLIKFTRYNAMGQPPVIDGQYLPLDKTQVKRGDWFFIAGSTKFNGAATVKTNAGMYQNIDALMFAEPGEEIKSEGSFNAQAAFAGFQGGQAPRANAPAGGTGFGQPQQPQQPSAPVQQPSAPVQQPSAPVQQPSAPVQQPSAPTATVKTYVHTCPQFTKEQYQAADPNWTEEKLVAAGKGRFDESPAPQAAPQAAPTASGVQPAHDFLNQPGYVPNAQ